MVIEQWVDAYAARLYRAAAMLATEAEAPDLCQETFMIAARRREAFQGRSAPYTWLFGILRNLVRDRRKKTTRRARLRLISPPRPDVDTSDPEGEVSARQDRARVRDAISTLPAPQREVVVLFYLEELSVSDVAGRLGIAPGTVKSRLFKARSVLKHALSGGR